MNLKLSLDKFNNFISYIGSIGNGPNDNHELKSLKTILTITCYVAISNLVFFSFVYDDMGRRAVAITLLVFSSYLTISLIFFIFHRNFLILRNLMFIGIYFYIIFYQCIMGGYIGSTGYILYGILVLNGVQMFYKKESHKYAWYFLYMITAIVLFFLEPIVSKNMVPVPKEFVLITFLNAFILISSITMLSTRYFIRRINQEKLKSDNLIRNILPDSVVDELNQKGIYMPIMVPKATAIFLDFVSFSKNTFNLNPQDLVASLNEHFSAFDEIFKRNNVEKLKTIGDGYMAVGGIPDSNNTHPLDVAVAALEILKYIDNLKEKKRINDWDVRIGIHTGPMVAGIIGKTKFAYDVWGNSVNLCARLETTSKPNCINVSHEFMQNTIEFFDYEPRGLIEIKNGQPTEMFFLKDLKEHFRSETYLPNQKFQESYQEYSNLPFES